MLLSNFDSGALESHTRACERKLGPLSLGALRAVISKGEQLRHTPCHDAMQALRPRTFFYICFFVCVCFSFFFFFVPWSWAAAFAWAQRTLEYDRSYSSPMLLQALGCKCSPIPLTLSAPTASPAIVIPQPPSPLQRHLPLPLSPLHVTLTRPLPRHPTTQSPCLPTFSVWAPHECVSQKFGSSGG